MPEAPPRVRLRFRDVFDRDPTSRYVSPEAIQKQTEELIDTDSELSVERDLRDAVVAGVLKRRDAILDACREELSSLERTPPIWREGIFLVYAITATFAAGTLTVSDFMKNPMDWGLPDGNLIGPVIVGTGLVGATQIFIRRKSKLQVTLARLREGIRNQLRALIRLVATELADSELRWANTFDATEAPALVNMDLQDAVSSASYARVREFVRGHSASAIGIAGSRGAGKSTLMQQLRFDPTFRCIGVRIAAPVYYGAADFIRLIHWELATEALTWARRNPGNGFARRPALVSLLWPDIRRHLRWLVLLAVTLLLVLAWIYDREDMRQIDDLGSYASESLAGFRIGALGLVALVGLSTVAGYITRAAWQNFQSGARLTAPRPTVAGIAAQQLELLRWSATVEKSAKTSLKVERLGFEGQNKYTRAERERSHADSVRALREFIANLIALAPDDVGVLICVDELDKIADPQQSVETVNGIKDLFHIPGAHFLVSVSSDALSNFHARGVPLRDVFDSSFDTMIRMEPLSFEECRDLISRRARGFPSNAVMFCYAWAGGNARDLIRTARACVDYRRGGPPDTSLAGVVSHVLRMDLNEVLDAAIEKLRVDHEAELEGVLSFRERVQQPDVPLSNALATALQQTPLPVAPQRASEAQLLAAALDPYSRIAGLTMLLFGTSRSPEDWQLPSVRAELTPSPTPGPPWAAIRATSVASSTPPSGAARMRSAATSRTDSSCRHGRVRVRPPNIPAASVSRSPPGLLIRVMASPLPATVAELSYPSERVLLVAAPLDLGRCALLGHDKTTRIWCTGEARPHQTIPNRSIGGHRAEARHQHIRHPGRGHAGTRWAAGGPEWRVPVRRVVHQLLGRHDGRGDGAVLQRPGRPVARPQDVRDLRRALAVHH